MADEKIAARDALQRLLQVLEDRAPELAREVQAAVDRGHDENVPEKRAGKAVRIYRKTVPLSEIEAFRAALNVLRAHFLEQPLIAASALDAFETSRVGQGSKESRSVFRSSIAIAPGDTTTVELEVVPETQISPSDEPLFRIERVSTEHIREQRANFEAVRSLVEGARADDDAWGS